MIQFNSDDDIPALIDEAKRLTEEARRIVDSSDASTWHAHPSDGGWSAAECFQHLIEVSSKMLPNLGEVVESMKADESKRPDRYHYSMFERMFVYLASGSEERPKVRFKAPTLYVPQAALETNPMLDEFERWQGDLINVISNLKGKDPSKTKMPSPAASWLKVSVGQWIVLLLVHQSRHLSQARRALEAAAV